MDTKISVGIDDMAIYVPELYFDIPALAKARNLDADKLTKGLGLLKMAIPDVHEDTATMGANALWELIEKNNLHPSEISRIYLGTESSLDGSKPTATYIHQMIESRLIGEYGENCLRKCDVVDMTFACIGGVDALHNSLDWIRVNPTKKAVIICADVAKYELNSTGEYTQGAGAVAILVSTEPRLMHIDNTWGISCKGEHDFFKPIRKYKKKELMQEIFDLMEYDIDLDKLIEDMHANEETKGVFDAHSHAFHVHKDTPVFDGQYSNKCYQLRMEEAFEDFVSEKEKSGTYFPLDEWASTVFHLPYAYHAKRVFSAVFMKELKRKGIWDTFCDKHQIPVDVNPQTKLTDIQKLVSKTPEYRNFVQMKMEKGQRASSLIGNMYTASIFQSLMSDLQSRYDDSEDLSGQKIGLVAYGSGSKSKVFEGIIGKEWKSVVSKFNMWEKLKQRISVDYNTYIDLHSHRLHSSVRKIKKSFVHDPSMEHELNLSFIRGYRWVE